MRRLMLVKHSLPDIDPGRPATQWTLSAEGRRRCAPLAETLRNSRPARIVASTEPKAAETAALLARHLDLPVSLDRRLREHDRSDVGWLTEPAFDRAIAGLFAHPERRVFGAESAVEAERRFASGVADALATCPDDSPAIVAHGTVISLFVAARADVDPFALWRRLGLPSVVVLSLPHFRIEAEIAKIPAADPPADRENAP